MIEVVSLTDGGQKASDIAARLAAFVAGAQRSIEVATYDFALSAPVAAPVVDAFRAAVDRGVGVRLLYNVDHAKPIPVPPPPRVDIDLVARSGAQAKPVSGIPDLMHHKYVVVDGERLWTGSTNWTDDSFTREENVILTLTSPPIAAAYQRDFEDLWSSGSVLGSGEHDSDVAEVDGAQVRARFCPGGAKRLAHRIAKAIGSAQRRVRVCSPVITAGPILGTLVEVAGAHAIDLAGVYDATQMNQVMGQWRADPHAGWKVPAFQSLIHGAPFGGKRSTPYAPGSTHDFMHAKVTVADDVTFVGSYNLSHSGQENAENVLEIVSPAIADQLAAFIDRVRARYPA